MVGMGGVVVITGVLVCGVHFYLLWRHEKCVRVGVASRMAAVTFCTACRAQVTRHQFLMVFSIFWVGMTALSYCISLVLLDACDESRTRDQW